MHDPSVLLLGKKLGFFVDVLIAFYLTLRKRLTFRTRKLPRQLLFRKKVNHVSLKEFLLKLKKIFITKQRVFLAWQQTRFLGFYF